MTKQADYVVEVKGDLRGTPAVVAERVADALKLTPQKAASLVARMPGVITKPLPEERALRVVLRLQGAGLSAFHRRVTPAEGGTEDPELASDAPVEPPREGRTEDPELATDTPVEAPEGAPESAQQDEWGDPGVRHPTGYDQIPSLDATEVDESDEDVKLTPMREAGFGAADIVVPTEDRRGSKRDTPTFVESGPISRPDDADPTMVMPPDAEPDSGDAVRGEGEAAEGDAAGAEGAPRPTSRLRDAIARDRGSDRKRRPTLGDDDLRLTPPSEVSYRSTKSAAERQLTLTPPPDEVLKRSGVRDDELASVLARRRGRFGRRLSALVALPVTLSWLLSATFIYFLLPEAVRGELWVPLAAATAIAALTGALAAALATGRIASDVVRMREDADRIAMGDLSAPVRVRRSDELGDVAASLDRMRVSLQEALERLRKRR